MSVHNLSFYPLQGEGHGLGNSLLDNSPMTGISSIYSIDHLKTTDGGLYSQMFSIVISPSYINENYKIIPNSDIYNFNNNNNRAQIKQSFPYPFNHPTRKNKSESKAVTYTCLCLVGMSEWFSKIWKRKVNNIF